MSTNLISAVHDIVLESGLGAKNIAAAIYAVLKNRDKNKIKGRQRLTAMLKSGKELKVFTIGKRFVKVVKKNLMKIILLMIVMFADLRFLKRE